MENKIEYLKSMGVDVEQGISNMIDFETYDEILNDFYNSMKDELLKIENYKNSNDMANYAILVHAMKSNARSFGFMKLGDICYEHEMKSKAGDASYVNEHFNELLNAFNEVYTIITNYKNL